jgi:hypothetical protein
LQYSANIESEPHFGADRYVLAHLLTSEPDSLREMEPLFLAVICGCNAGLLRAALHEVYVPRIQRGNAKFTANVLGARGALLAVLVHFFEHGCWGSPVEMGVERQSLTAEDRLFILMEAQEYLTVIRGWGAPEAGICSESAVFLGTERLKRTASLCPSKKGFRERVIRLRRRVDVRRRGA